MANRDGESVGNGKISTLPTNSDRLRKLYDDPRAHEPADVEFPATALRAHRAKGNKTQRVSLPEGYLEARDDDTPPRSPHSPEEIEAWEQTLAGG